MSYQLLRGIGERDLSIVAKVLDENPNAAKERDSYNLLPIHMATGLGEWEIALLLAEAFPKGVLELTERGDSVINSAIRNHADVAVILKIIQTCPKALLKRDKKGNLPLHVALESNHDASLCLALIEQCTSAVAIEDGKSYLPIHRAVRNNATSQVLAALLQYSRRDALVDCDGRLPLHIALEHKVSIDRIEFLVEHNPSSLLIKDSFGLLPLHIALIKKTYDNAAYLIKRNRESAFEKDSWNDLPIHTAAADQAWDIVDLLAQLNTPCWERDRCGRLPVFLAAKNQRWKTVVTLARANPLGMKEKDTFGNLLLHLSIRGKAWSAVLSLLKLDPSCAIVLDADSYTPAMLAAKYGAPFELISAISHAHIDALNYTNPDTIPLHIAIANRNWNTVNALAKIHPLHARIINEKHRLPIQCAVACNAPDETIQCLCRAYPMACSRLDKTGRTMAHVIALSHRWFLLLCFVQEFPLIATIQDASEKLVLDYAIEMNAPSKVIIELILACGKNSYFARVLNVYQFNDQDLNNLASNKEFLLRTDDQGNTPCHLAVEYLHPRMVVRFIAGGANLFALNSAGESVLDLGRRCNVPSIRVMLDINVLVQDKEWINSVNAEGKTPLHCAVLANDVASVRALLQNGVDVHHRDNHGKRAVDYISSIYSFSAIHKELVIASSEKIILRERYVVDVQGNDGYEVGFDLSSGKVVRMERFISKGDWLRTCTNMEKVNAAADTLHFATVVEVFEHSGSYWIISNQDGVILAQMLAWNRGISLPMYCLFLKHISEGLLFLHKKMNVVHFRLSPSSIFISMASTYHIASLRYCCPCGTSFGEENRYQDLEVSRYLPPEAAMFYLGKIDMFIAYPTYDIWSLGCIIFEMCTGEPFITGEDSRVILEKISSLDDSSLDDRLLLVPMEYRENIAMMLNLVPEKRVSLEDLMLSAATRMETADESPMDVVKDTHDAIVYPTALQISLSESLPCNLAQLVILCFERQQKEIHSIISSQANYVKEYAQNTCETMKLSAIDQNIKIQQNLNQWYQDVNENLQDRHIKIYKDMMKLVERYETVVQRQEQFPNQMIKDLYLEIQKLTLQSSQIQRQLKKLQSSQRNHNHKDTHQNKKDTHQNNIDNDHNNKHNDQDKRLEGNISQDQEIDKRQEQISIGKIIKKEFDGGKYYQGKITNVRKDSMGKELWTVEYEDGDEEELENSEIRTLLVQDTIKETNGTQDIKWKNTHLRGKYAHSQQDLTLGAPIWLVHNQKLVAKGLVVEIDNHEEAIVRVTMALKSAPEQVKNIAQLKSEARLMPWKIKSCFIPSLSSSTTSYKTVPS